MPVEEGVVDGNLKRGKLLHAGIALTLVFGLSMATDAWAANAKRGIAAPGSSSLTGGPDGFGYYFVDQDEAILTFSWQDISGTGTLVTSGNEGVGSVTLGSGFSFYGTTYTDLVMSTNGYISTDLTDTGFDNSNDCPIPAVPDVGAGARMYPVHDDLVVNGGGYTQYYSPCPRTNELGIDGQAEDCTVFQWDDTNHFGSTATFSFDAQTILYHASGVVLHQIQNDLAAGAASTTGIQDPTGAVGLQYACNTPGSLNNNAAIAFYTCGTITVAPATLPGGVVGQAYNQTLTATGGTPAYTFAVTAGALPGGLTLSPAGVISGTPTGPVGTATFTVTATDAKGCAGSLQYTIDITDGCPTISVTPAVLPSGTVNTAYSVTVSATGGAAPYTFAITAGTLPTGLTLDPATGVISGTPTVAIEATVTVGITDANGCPASMVYCIVIIPEFNIFAGHGLGSSLSNTNAVEIFDATGTTTGVTWEAYGSGQWGTNVGSGNMRQDTPETAELLTGPGPGDVYGPHLRGWDRAGASINRVNLFAYGTLKFGVNVAAGNIEANGEPCTALAEILSGAGPGAVFGPHVRGWNFDGGPVTALQKINYFAYSTLKWGVNVDEGDTDGDGYAEILTGPGPGQIFGSTIRGWNFDGGTLSQMAGINFNAFTPLAWGVNVSGGDVDGDGFHEIVAARGPDNTASGTNDFAGFDSDGSPASALAGYTVTAHASMYGGRVGLSDLDGDGTWDLLAAEGRDPAASSDMNSYSYSGGALNAGSVAFTVFPGTNYGVNVNGAQLGY